MHLLKICMLACVMAFGMAVTPNADDKDISYSRQIFDAFFISPSEITPLNELATAAKAAIQRLIVLNPINWNLDFIIPFLGSVLTVYSGPIIILGLLLLVISTVPGLSTVITGGRRSLDSGLHSTLDETLRVLTYTWEQARRNYEGLEEEPKQR
ncbi:uncharacterized protein LOC143026938 [Oratosquilla oratoria]|uniref:uncharacterized protein LOC143026938 n=1 Tax=Oratosquilla oratoria TaxID=337810 RepID=UPI003F776910